MLANLKGRRISIEPCAMIPNEANERDAMQSPAKHGAMRTKTIKKHATTKVCRSPVPTSVRYRSRLHDLHGFSEDIAATATAIAAGVVVGRVTGTETSPPPQFFVFEQHPARPRAASPRAWGWIGEMRSWRCVSGDIHPLPEVRTQLRQRPLPRASEAGRHHRMNVNAKLPNERSRLTRGTARPRCRHMLPTFLRLPAQT